MNLIIKILIFLLVIPVIGREWEEVANFSNANFSNEFEQPIAKTLNGNIYLAVNQYYSFPIILKLDTNFNNSERIYSLTEASKNIQNLNVNEDYLSASRQNGSVIYSSDDGENWITEDVNQEYGGEFSDLIINKDIFIALFEKPYIKNQQTGDWEVINVDLELDVDMDNVVFDRLEYFANRLFISGYEKPLDNKYGKTFIISSSDYGVNWEIEVEIDSNKIDDFAVVNDSTINFVLNKHDEVNDRNEFGIFNLNLNNTKIVDEFKGLTQEPERFYIETSDTNRVIFQYFSRYPYIYESSDRSWIQYSINDLHLYMNFLPSGRSYIFAKKPLELRNLFIYAEPKEPTSVNSVFNSIKYNIYPNPSKDYSTLDLEIEKRENFKIDLYNSSGLFIRNINNGFLEVGQKTFAINLSGLSSGAYFITIESNSKSDLIKMIVE